MKRYCIVLSLLLLSISCWSADEIYAPNQDGFELAFALRTENTVKLVPPFKRYSWNAGGIYKDITTDTLHIPESIVYNGQQYTVTMLEEGALWELADTVRVVTIPQTIDTIAEPTDVLTGLALAKGVEKFIVDPRNPRYCSDEQGLVYTADMKFLLMCPMKASFDTLRLDNRIEDIGPAALTCLYSLRYLEMPAALKRIQALSFTSLDNLTQLVVKDSIEELCSGAFRLMGKLEKITLGANLKNAHASFLSSSKNVSEITLRAPIPPAVTYGSNDHTFLSENIKAGCRLLVPQKSIKAYKQADGWSQFGDNIFPIEPPIMATDEGVTISWVQSFSATGYIWYMYQDEEHTQLVMSLTFDQDGRLTEMAFGPAFGSGTQQAPARRADEDGEENAERFAEYYSFTIRNLSAKTNYYYTRQTLSGEEVIDTEDGTFNTDPDHVPTANGMLTLPERTTKTLQDGNVVIIRNGKRYLLNGAEVK